MNKSDKERGFRSSLGRSADGKIQDISKVGGVPFTSSKTEPGYGQGVSVLKELRGLKSSD